MHRVHRSEVCFNLHFKNLDPLAQILNFISGYPVQHRVLLMLAQMNYNVIPQTNYSVFIHREQPVRMR